MKNITKPKFENKINSVRCIPSGAVILVGKMGELKGKSEKEPFPYISTVLFSILDYV
jgi:hypothetical protein